MPDSKPDTSSPDTASPGASSPSDQPDAAALEYETVGVPSRITGYFLFLFVFLVVTGFFDTFATSFRYTMLTYVRRDFDIAFGDLAGMMSWVYLASSLAFVPRMLADVIGRKTMLCVTLVGLCAFQWGLGFARSPAEYIVLLSLLAVFYKSDIWILVMSEEAPPRHRGLWSALTAALTGLGGITVGGLVRNMADAPDAWRAIARFPVWGVLAVLPLLLWMRETKHYRANRTRPTSRPRFALLIAPFRGKTRNPLLLITLLKMFFIGGASVALALMGTEYLRTVNGFEQQTVGRVVQFDVLASMITLVTVGAISDRFGRRRTFFLSGCLYVFSLFGLFALAKGTNLILVLYVCQSLAGTGVIGILRVATMELLPNDCRATGSAWSDLMVTLTAVGTARLIRALTSGKILALGSVSLPAIIGCVAIFVLLVLPLYAFLRETRGQKLEDV